MAVIVNIAADTGPSNTTSFDLFRTIGFARDAKPIRTLTGARTTLANSADIAWFNRAIRMLEGSIARNADASIKIRNRGLPAVIADT
jgi:hypothetical protein